MLSKKEFDYSNTIYSVSMEDHNKILYNWNKRYPDSFKSGEKVLVINKNKIKKIMKNEEKEETK